MHQIHLRGMQVVALTALMILAFTGSLGLPFNIDAIAKSFGVGNSEAGLVVSFEMLAIAIGTLAIGAVARGAPARRIYALGILVIVLLNLLCMMVTNLWLLTALRVPVGFCLGAIVATVMATAARSDRPESTFGIINASVGAMGIVIGVVLPQALLLHDWLPLPTQLAGLYLVYAVFAAAAGLVLAAVPVAPPIEVVPGAAPAARFPPRRWLGLLGLGVLFFGHGVLGVFIVNLGSGIGMAMQHIGYVLSAGAVLGVAVPLLAGQYGVRVPAAWWVTTLAVLIVAFAFLVATAGTPTLFALAVPLYGVLPMALIPVFLGALARVDTTGRLAGAHPAFVLVGGAVAPFVGGALSDAGGFIANAAAVAACAAVGAVLMWGDLRRSDALRSVG
jgi:predicted MFS family arabinose efflux permease